ncbi:Putative ribonuclease H protein At1g65750, partial [Linum perenne]
NFLERSPSTKIHFEYKWLYSKAFLSYNSRSRDQRWSWSNSGAFSANLNICLISRAELTGIVRGMERAWEARIRELEVQTDSIYVVRLLLEEGHRVHQHTTIVERFKQLLERDWSVTVKHIYRKANHLADALANMGHNLDFGTHSVDTSDR